MKIIVIGASGTIGRKVTQHLKKKHEVIAVSRNSGDYQADIADSNSLEQLFKKVGKVDSIVCIAGEAKWAPFNELSEEDFYIGIKSKMMGQVNLTRIGKEYLIPNGSITLTTGILAEDPVYMTTSASMVNGAIHSFVKAAALELENDTRINVVAAGMVEDAADKYQDYFPGHNAVPMQKVISGYVRSVEGRGNGEIIRIYE